MALKEFRIISSASGNTGGLSVEKITTRSGTDDSGSGIIYGQWRLGGSSTLQATYADLAERYASDGPYEPGTLMCFGGECEITECKENNSHTVMGIISTNPAYMMNATAGDNNTHPYIALAGRVPCKVTGTVNKGDLLVSSNIPGHVMANNNAQSGRIVGKAMENFEGETGTIEVLVSLM